METEKRIQHDAEWDELLERTRADGENSGLAMRTPSRVSATNIAARSSSNVRDCGAANVGGLGGFGIQGCDRRE
jgi:hypothetical protein